MLAEIEGLNKWERINEIDGNSIPDMIMEDNDNSFWNINIFGITKQEFLEKIMAYIPTYEFDTKKFKVLDDSTYELVTTEGKTITLKINSQGKNICETRRTGTISLIDGNNENIYLIATESLGNKLFIELIKTIEMDTGIEKEYDGDSNTFTKPMGDKKISIKIATYGIYDDKNNMESVEKYFKRKVFNNVMDGYHFVLYHLPACYNTFTVTTYDKDGKEEDCVEVRLGGLKKLALTRIINGKPVRITDEFKNPLNNENVINLLAELHDLKDKQANMIRQMKQWTEE